VRGCPNQRTATSRAATQATTIFAAGGRAALARPGLADYDRRQGARSRVGAVRGLRWRRGALSLLASLGVAAACASTTGCSGAPDSELFGGGGDGQAEPTDGAGPDRDGTLPVSDGAPGDGTDETAGPTESGAVSDAGTWAVPCADAGCMAPGQFCCVVQETYVCDSDVNHCKGQGGTPVLCSSSAQCSAGQQVCCGLQTGGGSSYSEVSCTPKCRSGVNEYIFCDPNRPPDCPDGTTCKSSHVVSLFHICN
jgi:hypothetical protein